MTAAPCRTQLRNRLGFRARIKMEREANELALEILIPGRALEELLEESGGKIHLKKWAGKFKVSQTMVAWRLGLPCYWGDE